MRRFLLCLLCSCSTPNPANDGGLDASPGDSIAADAPVDAPVDAPSDSNACNVTASATVTGTFSGNAFNAQASAAIENYTTSYYVVVEITDYQSTCGLSQSPKANTKWMTIAFDSNSPIVPGTLDKSTANGLVVNYGAFNATCNPTTVVAQAGTVTFTRVDDCAVAGSFDLMFNADHVTGTFTAPVCTPPDGGGGTCM